MPIKPIVGHVYDVYNNSQRKMRRAEPKLLPPLKKALKLCLDDHVVIHPPEVSPDRSRLWIASVYTQTDGSHQYEVYYDRAIKRFVCNCPSYQLHGYRIADGRCFCKHMIAVQIMIKAHRRHGKRDPENVIAKFVATQDRIMATPFKEVESVAAD